MINIEVLFFFSYISRIEPVYNRFCRIIRIFFFQKRLIELYLLWSVSYIIFAFNNTLLLFIIIFLKPFNEKSPLPSFLS